MWCLKLSRTKFSCGSTLCFLPLKKRGKKAHTNPLLKSLQKLKCMKALTEVDRNTPVKFGDHLVVPRATCVSKLFKLAVLQNLSEDF